jgi:hypothetical protein
MKFMDRSSKNYGAFWSDRRVSLLALFRQTRSLPSSFNVYSTASVFEWSVLTVTHRLFSGVVEGGMQETAFFKWNTSPKVASSTT